MLKKERQMYILEKVEKNGRATTNELVEELGVAEDTIRKDFQEMSKQGLVTRIHGGVLRQEKGLIDFNDRIHEQPSVKEQLARTAAELLKEVHILYLDGGTTNLKLAEALPEEFSGTIVTNSPAIATALCPYSNVQVMLLGGILNKTTRIVEGTSALQQMADLNFECSVIGVSSLSPDHGITFPSYDESILKREAIRRSRKTMVIANREKLGTVAGFYTCGISEIDVLVTNEQEEEILKPYKEAGIQILSEA